MRPPEPRQPFPSERPLSAPAVAMRSSDLLMRCTGSGIRQRVPFAAVTGELYHYVRAADRPDRSMPRAWVPVALDLVLSLGRFDSLPLHIGGCIGSAYGKRLDVIDNIVRAGAARPSCRGAPVLPLELITSRGRPADCDVMLRRCGCCNAVTPVRADIGGRPTADRV
jgi:hypothetical protein